MKCPKCPAQLRAWPSPDGGYKGVQCDGCDTQWRSEGFEHAAYEVERAAVRELVAKLPFPPDAQTEADYWAYLDEILKGADDGAP